MLTSDRPPPLKATRRYLQQFPLLVAAKKYLWKMFVPRTYDRAKGTSHIDLVASFPLFAPFSEGKYKDKALLTVQTINQTMPLLSSLATLAQSRKLRVSPIQNFPTSDRELQTISELKKFLDAHGSDKANTHNYHFLYGSILKDTADVKKVLEIGLGTDNTDVVSNMGSRGKPGASLRAFRDFFPNASIYGADVDKRILFTEERIQTFFVDQTDSETFNQLGKLIPMDLDLVIDDGLHSPNANLATMIFALDKVKAGGWVVIEDISPDAIPFWEVVSAILPETYQRHLFSAEAGLVFAVRNPG
jgi:hypothetical protein